ncbi:MAG: hypothetical protein HAW62_03335 [Endozoicomonadaceae bacterium]|nr:hypothetical protein [Endozoicomonadaceae bacterium]
MYQKISKYLCLGLFITGSSLLFTLYSLLFTQANSSDKPFHDIVCMMQQALDKAAGPVIKYPDIVNQDWGPWFFDQIKYVNRQAALSAGIGLGLAACVGPVTVAVTTNIAAGVAATMGAKMVFNCITSTALPQKIQKDYQTFIALMTSMGAGITASGASNIAGSIGSVLGSHIGYGGAEMLTEEAEKKTGYSIPDPVKAVINFAASLAGGILGSNTTRSITSTIDGAGLPVSNAQDIIYQDICLNNQRNIYNVSSNLVSQKFAINNILNSNDYFEATSNLHSVVSLIQCNETLLSKAGQPVSLCEGRDGLMGVRIEGDAALIEYKANHGRFCNCGTTPQVTPSRVGWNGGLFGDEISVEAVKGSMLEQGGDDYNSFASTKTSSRALPLSKHTRLIFPEGSLEDSLGCNATLGGIPFRNCVDSTALDSSFSYQYATTKTEFYKKMHEGCCLSVQSNSKAICGCDDNPRIDLTYPDGIPAGNITEQDLTASFFQSVTDGRRAVHLSNTGKTDIIREGENGRLTCLMPASILVKSRLSSVCFHPKSVREYIIFKSLEDLQSVYYDNPCIAPTAELITDNSTVDLKATTIDIDYNNAGIIIVASSLIAASAATACIIGSITCIAYCHKINSKKNNDVTQSSEMNQIEKGKVTES